MKNHKLWISFELIDRYNNREYDQITLPNNQLSRFFNKYSREYEINILLMEKI